MKSRSRWPLTPRFAQAFHWAARWHSGQRRKGTAIPYIAHPMAVASLVLEHGGTQAQAMAALLHDVMEDCGVPERELRRRFGREVASLVRECSDAVSKPKPPWEARKRAYMAHLGLARAQTLLISAADKLHNASAINRDLEGHGPRVWKRFSAPPSRIAWYYRELLKVYKRRSREMTPEFPALIRDLEAQVKELAKRASGFAAALVIAGMTLFPVSAVAAGKQAPEPPLDGMVRRIMAEGFDTVFPDDLAPHMGLPQRTPTRRELVERRDSADGGLRMADVALDISSPPPKPKAIILVAKKIDKASRISTTLMLKLSIKGALEKGLVIRRSGTVTGSKAEKLDIKAPETLRLFQRELDFWLKGVGRKPKTAAPQPAP